MSDLFEGLQALHANAFPKTCACCGMVFTDQAHYIAGTVPVAADKSGFKSMLDDDEHDVLGWFRNCKCGSTLLTYHLDRRDMSAQGLKRREKFAALQQRLLAVGWTAEEARQALLAVVQRGEVTAHLQQALKQARSD